jgi:hypothetical protein
MPSLGRRAATLAGLLTLVMVMAFGGVARAEIIENTDFAPQIWSDKADYAPGELVTLSGSHWQPGESVHVYVNDDTGSTWSRDVDVTADATGNVTDSFNLPDWFVAQYSVKATGSVTGSVATTSFTDGNFQIRNPATTPSTAGADFKLENLGSSVTLANCPGAPAPTKANDSKSLRMTGPSTNLGLEAKNGDVIRITATAIADSGWTVDKYSSGTTAVTPTNGVACVADTAANGNMDFDVVYRRSDDTAPTVTVTSPTAPTGQNGYFNATNVAAAGGSLTVDVSASDPSGVTTISCTHSANGGPAQQATVTGQSGSNPRTGRVSVSAEGTHVITCTATDALNNSGASNRPDNAGQLKIDKTGPVISDLGTATRPNDAGWYRTDVSNGFKATDAGGSGLGDACKAAFPANAAGDNVQSKSTTAEGTAVRATSDGCTDVAGNAATGKDSAAFKVDKTKPVATYTGADRAPNANGWYNADVTASFKATDNLSGFNTAGDLTKTGTTVADTEGKGVTVSSPAFTDQAGNEAVAVKSAGFDIDKTAPKVTSGLSPVPNAAGWNNADVTVSFDATDNLSGFDAAATATDSDSAGVTAEGKDIGVTSKAFVDRAGNTATGTATVNLDKTAPKIALLSRLPEANAAGWNNTAVAVRWDCADQVGLSGAVDAQVSDTVSTEGANQSAKGTCADNAGNSASNSKAGISIDKTAPTITLTAPADGASYKWNAPAAASYSCDGGLSGTDTCSGPVASGSNFVALPVGPKAFSVAARDKAGNEATKRHEYKVVYDFAGFFQPIDMGSTYNSAQAGRAIPVKFKLGGNAGLDVFATNLQGVKFPTSVAVACPSAGLTDAVEEVSTAATSGLKYDAQADQYIYTWKTDATWAGKCRQLNVQFADGMVAPVAYFKFTK